MEFERLVVHTRLSRVTTGIPFLRPRKAVFDVHIDQQRQIGSEAAAGDAVEREDRLFPEASRAPLVGKG